MPMDWKIGARVTREQFMEDGTWDEQGDDCLARSPLMHGEVVAVEPTKPPLYRVLWDGADKECSYFGHGIDAERTD